MKRTPIIPILILSCLNSLFPEAELTNCRNKNEADSAPSDRHSAETYDVKLVKSEMKPLDLTTNRSYSSQTLSYFNYYDLDFDVLRCFGTFESQGFDLAAHLFDPGNARGTVFLLHGYYDHTGILRNIVRLCIEEQLAVAVFDFPGHGLSTGVTASIDSFSQYVAVFKDFFEFCRPHIAEPYYLIGHSMGTAVILEYLFQTKGPPFEKVILLAPIVRCSYYYLSRIGHFLMSPFWDTAPRWFRKSSSDKRFLDFYRNDPLQCSHFPMKWADSFYLWNRRIKSYGTISTAVAVIQGTRDNVVDWRHNIPFLRQRIPNLEAVYIKKARHQLMNEGEPFLDEFLEALRMQLGSG